MTAHPSCCADHSCDFCDICIGGQCCMSRPIAVSAGMTTSTDFDVLREAVSSDLESRSGLTELVRIEFIQHTLDRQDLTPVPVKFAQPGAPPERPLRQLPDPQPLALPSGSALDSFTHHLSNQEKEHSNVTRTYDQ
jgi:hypothetical protein